MEEEIDRKLKALHTSISDQLERTLEKFVGNSNARLAILETSRLTEGFGGQIGPIKTTKPYARPPMAEGTRAQHDNTQPTKHGH